MTKPYVIHKSDHAHSPSRSIGSLFQGAFIDDDGNEVIITEEMIQQACRAFEEDTLNHKPYANNKNLMPSDY